jgi:hypothetical protein
LYGPDQYQFLFYQPFLYFCVLNNIVMKLSLKAYYWVPRILAIMAILFISMFALDSFEAGLTAWQQLQHFVLHLIPSFVLLAVLAVAWRWEHIGGIIYLILGLSLTPFVFAINYHRNHSIWISLMVILVITMPFVLVGILFLVSNRQGR